MAPQYAWSSAAERAKELSGLAKPSLAQSPPPGGGAAVAWEPAQTRCRLTQYRRPPPCGAGTCEPADCGHSGTRPAARPECYLNAQLNGA